MRHRPSQLWPREVGGARRKISGRPLSIHCTNQEQAESQRRNCLLHDAPLIVSPGRIIRVRQWLVKLVAKDQGVVVVGGHQLTIVNGLSSIVPGPGRRLDGRGAIERTYVRRKNTPRFAQSQIDTEYQGVSGGL